jgi:hypothetical protein
VIKEGVGQLLGLFIVATMRWVVSLPYRGIGNYISNNKANVGEHKYADNESNDKPG